eukprot:gene35535-43085_t
MGQCNQQPAANPPTPKDHRYATPTPIVELQTVTDLELSPQVLDHHEREPGRMEKDTFVQEVVDYCAKRICLDISRLNFIRENACTVYFLVSGKLRGDTRFRRTLLGRKGVGKSVLLSTFADAIRNIAFSSNVIVILLSCSSSEESSPKTALCSAAKVSRDLTWEELWSLQVIRSRKVFFLIDEFNFAFHKSSLRGRDYISDVQGIGEEMLGLCHCILSGSSSVLRKLITAKLSIEEAQNLLLTNYSCLDLKGSKFDFRTIVPFSQKADLDNLLGLCKLRFGQLPADVHLETVVLETDGFPGLIVEYCKSGQFASSKHVIGLRTLTPHQFTILNNVLSAVKELLSSFSPHQEHISNEFSWVNMVHVDTVDTTMDVSDLYDLSDMGYLVFVEEGIISTKVGFYSARIYLEMLARTSDTFTLTDLVSLSHPHGPYKAHAEYVVAKILTGPTGTSLLSSVLCITSASQQQSSMSRLNELVLEDAALQSWSATAVSSSEIPYNTFLKECYGAKKADCFTADLAFIDKETNIVHKIQLKLGKSRLTDADFDEIGQRFVSMRADAESAYGRLGLSLQSSRNYLFTTRSFDPRDSAVLASFGVCLIDNKLLKQHCVWPQVVKDLGKPYK